MPSTCDPEFTPFFDVQMDAFAAFDIDGIQRN